MLFILGDQGYGHEQQISANLTLERLRGAGAA